MLRKYRTMLLPLALAAMFSLALLACGTTTDAVDSSQAVAPGTNTVAVVPDAQTATTEPESALKPTVIAPEQAEAMSESAVAAPAADVANDTDSSVAVMVEDEKTEEDATAAVMVEAEKAEDDGGAMATSATSAEMDAQAAVAAVEKMVEDSMAEARAAMLDADAVVAAHEEVLAGIYQRALASAVRIEVAKDFGEGGAPQDRRPFGGPGAPEGLVPQGQGSGFVWSDDGYIVTNHHVVAGADRVTVIFADGWEAIAKVLGSDPDSDLAVLKIEVPEGGLTALELGDSAELRVGQLTVAIGAPFGQSFTMTRGIVSALGRTIPSAGSSFSNPEVIQTDAPINPGNSGGPLLDRRGRVIGINSQIVSSSGASAGVGFSVPINTARRVVPVLIADGTYEYSYLGIQGGDLRPRIAEAKGLAAATRGVLVGPVVEGGPAASAGLVPNIETVEIDGERLPTGGDVITSVDGMNVETMADLLAYLTSNTNPGDTISLGLIRDDGEEASVEVTLTRRPEPTELRPPA